MENKYKDFDWTKLNFDFGNWEEEKIWALDLLVEEIPIELLLWHLDIPFWDNDLNVRWSLTPRDVINMEPLTSVHRKQIELADLNYPIEIYYNKDRWLILDGLHRLVKIVESGASTLKVRKLPSERFTEVKSEYPIELPS